VRWSPRPAGGGNRPDGRGSGGKQRKSAVRPVDRGVLRYTVAQAVPLSLKVSGAENEPP
jgi:hypothetical protein